MKYIVYIKNKILSVVHICFFTILNSYTFDDYNSLDIILNFSYIFWNNKSTL